MKRTKQLIFSSFDMFAGWYSRMKTRFESLKLVLIRHFKSARSVAVVITY